MKRSLTILILLLTAAVSAYGQTDRKEVRHGNREFKKENFQNAEIDYKKALLKDSLSNAANFNLGNTYYRMENYQEADRYYAAVSDSLDRAGHGAESYFNQGDSFLKQRNWQAAVEAFKNSLRRNPDDMDAKSNLAYAQKMLENQQGGGGGQNDQNQDQNQQNQNQDQQNNDQNQDQQDQNQDQQNNDQNQDQQDQNQDQQNNDQNQDQQDQQNQSGEQPKISPQAAQQMLQAIQDQEKQTQDKVNKEKAAKLKSKQKEKNW